MIALAIVSWSGLGAGAAFAQIAAQVSTRLIDVVQVSKHGRRVAITVTFNCSMRYLTHFPATHGRQVRVRLQPLAGCGMSPFSHILSQIPPLSGPRHIVTSVRLYSDAPGQVVLSIGFASDEQFVVSPAVSLRGLRIRLIPPPRPPGKMFVGGIISHPTYFAVNLASQRTPFPPSAVAAARARLGTPVFVSQRIIAGHTWYRLRAGPFGSRAAAERVLSAAVVSYPTAWIAIGASTQASGSAAPPATGRRAPVPQVGTAAPLPPRVRAQLLSQATEALQARHYATAIRLLTELQQQPEFPGRARAQELLGLARERAGQLAQAQAEYEEYLRLYPNGPAADRVARRLRILREATLPGGPGIRALKTPSPWQLSGDLTQLFRYDGSHTNGSSSSPPAGSTAGAASPAQTLNEDALYSDVDLLVRHNGASSDWISRLSAGYTRRFGSTTFSNGALDNRANVSLASIEYDEHSLGLLARVGRQVRDNDGILGTYDGLFASYDWRPGWAVQVAGGYPVDLLSSPPQTDRRFESLAFALSPPGAHWSGSVFGTLESYDGLRDRRAVGFQGEYLAARASLVAMLDYDTSYHSLNAAMLLGTLQLPARWTVSFDAERRNSPVLTTQNALIGQSVTTLLALEQAFTPGQIYQLARDRTPKTDNFSLTITRPLGERFELVATATADRTAATVASGGVAAQPASGLEYSYQAQLFGSSLWSRGDFNAATLTYANTEFGKLESVDLSTRLPLVGAWRIGPQIELDRQQVVSGASTTTTVDPSFIVDYQHGLDFAELEIGGDLSRQSNSLSLQRSRQYYVSLSYTIGFQR